MPLAVGQSLSFFEILGPLGAGGMGEGYRARDTRLEREVAIKVLPEELADDVDRPRRFEREAKLAKPMAPQPLLGAAGALLLISDPYGAAANHYMIAEGSEERRGPGRS